MKWICLFTLVTLTKGDLLNLNILKYQNITVADINMVCSFFENATISDKCREQLDIVCANSTLLMTILDASSKFPYPGLAYSSRNDYGNYDQCMTVDHNYSGGRILGEFCGVGLVMPDIFGDVSNEDISVFNNWFALSVCRPNGCSASDYNIIVNQLMSRGEEEVEGLFLDEACSTVEKYSTYSTGDIVVLSIFGIVTFLMVVSTLYDICLYYSELKCVHPLFLAFSVLTNGRKLLHISKHSTFKEQIEVFHGIRVISMVWIVAGHGMAMWAGWYVTNAQDVLTWMPRFSSFYMTASHLAVDTFFFMSGFLLAFQYLKGEARTFFEQAVSVPQMVFHRYLRLTPAMLMLYLMTITFFVHLGNGPFYPVVADSTDQTCQKHWWRFFLYIQNYFDNNDICLSQTWYLLADMQMFLISPLVLIPVSLQLKYHGFKSTICGLLILNIIFTFLPMVLTFAIRSYKNELDTHSRLIDYFIGIMLGTFMRAEIDKPFLYMMPERLRLKINIICWCSIILGMLAVILCYQDQLIINHEFKSRTIFEGLMRPAWCIGLSWITYSCYHGYGGFVNWILCRPIFQMLGRLTYCIYLIHISVMLYSLGTSRAKWHFTEYTSFYQFCGYYVVSVIVAIFWTLAFESPLIIIEKYFLGGSKDRARGGQFPKIPNIEEGCIEKK